MNMTEIYKLPSERKREKERAGKPVIYNYDNIPKRTLGQIEILIEYLVEEIEKKNMRAFENVRFSFWGGIGEFLRMRYGDSNVNFGNSDYRHPRNYCLSLWTGNYSSEIEYQLDFLEQVCRRAYHQKKFIDAINYSLKEGQVGYQFENGKIIRMDNSYMHKEVVLNALQLINEEGFSGANEYFMSAHDHYRHGKNSEAITNAYKAFESTMKLICEKMGYSKIDKEDHELFNMLRKKNLFPNYLEGRIDDLLRYLSKASVIRNKVGAHAEKEKKPIPNHLVAYAIHSAAANIVFLIECMKEWKKRNSS